jgi:multicomponent Na+:H+ antiporter subunit F
VISGGAALQVGARLSEGLLYAALALAFVRLARGPSLPDRVVALDLLASLAVALGAVYAIRFGSDVFLGPSLVLALLSFLGTVAVARFLERSGRE